MSVLVKSFDPTDNTLLGKDGNGLIQTNGHNKDEQLVLYNSSLVCFQLTFLDKSTDIMPPSWAKSFKKKGPMGSVTYTPIFTLPVPANSQPVSLCYGTLYESGEHIADLNMPLQYVYNIGNVVNTVGGVASSVQNDTNPTGVSVVEATVSGDATSAVSILNNGQAQLGNTTTRPGQLLIVNTNGDSMLYYGDGIGTSNNPYRFVDTRTNQTKIYGFGNTAGQGVGLGGGGVVDVNIDVTGFYVVNGISSFDNGKVVTDGNGRFNQTPPTTVLNGGGGGTATLIQDTIGTIKRVLIVLNAFKTGASNQFLTFPTPFTTGLRLDAGNIGSSVSASGMHLLSGGSAVLRNVITALSDTGGTVTSTTNPFYGNSLVLCDHAVDQLQFDANWTATHSGTIEITGE